MSYNVKNYMEQGGDKWVIGGTLEIKEGASVTGLPAAEVPQAANQAAPRFPRRQTRPTALRRMFPLWFLISTACWPS